MKRAARQQQDGRDARRDVDGVLLLDKPAGITSHTAVQRVLRLLRARKGGHTGTLDPLATGVLVMGLGKATRILQQLMVTDKVYRTEIDLSAFTTTDDLEGEAQPVEVETPPGAAAIEAALQKFVGNILQRPPAFSAVKVGGRRAYDLARKGRPPDLAPRPITIHEITLRRYEWPVCEIDLRCAKGVYVRSLARDLGEALGTGGHCRSIRRLAVGPFTLAMATELDELPDVIGEGELMSVEEALELVGDDVVG